MGGGGGGGGFGIGFAHDGGLHGTNVIFSFIELLLFRSSLHLLKRVGDGTTNTGFFGEQQNVFGDRSH